MTQQFPPMSGMVLSHADSLADLQGRPRTVSYRVRRALLLPLLAVVAILTGCATNYDAYAKAQTDIAVAQSNAETARLLALAKIAESGDAGAKIGAVFALALSGQRGAVTQLQAPADPVLEWARILVPGATNIADIIVRKQIAIHSSDNAVRMQEVNMGAVKDVAIKGIDAAAKDPVIVEPFVVETAPATTP